MKYFYIIIITFSGCSINKLENAGVYKELSSENYYKFASDSSNIIIDVRTPKEYKNSHIDKAINVSYFGSNFKKEILELNLDTTKTILIYCQTQHRSLMVANKLNKLGFSSIIDLDKGMKQWKKDKMPVLSLDNK